MDSSVCAFITRSSTKSCCSRSAVLSRSFDLESIDWTRSSCSRSRFDLARSNFAITGDRERDDRSFLVGELDGVTSGVEGAKDGDLSTPSYDSAANDCSRLRQGLLARISCDVPRRSNDRSDGVCMLSPLDDPLRGLSGVLGDENNDRGVLCAEEGHDHAVVLGENSDEEEAPSSADFSGEEIREKMSMFQWRVLLMALMIGRVNQ